MLPRRNRTEGTHELFLGIRYRRGHLRGGQLFLDLTALTPARILTGYVVAGVVLSALGWYAPLAEFAGCGATVPLLGFGHLLAKGVRTALAEEGAIGILTGGLTAAAAGITTSLVCGVVCSLVGRSHDQN